MAVFDRGTSRQETFGSTSPVTGGAPSSATDGQPVQDLSAIMVGVSVASGVTLSGAGTLDAYVYDPSIGFWARDKSADFTVDATGNRAQVFAALDIKTPRNGRRKWVPTGVTFSAGSAGLSVWQLGYSKSAKGQYP